MKCRFACCSLLILGFLIPSPASAAPGVVARGQATGTVTAISGSSFTIQTAGRRTGVVNALTAAANGVTGHDYPYVYGGGHAQAGIASIGIKGPGYNGRRIGFDCSGSVAAVLAGGGLWPAGSGVPNDAGIISTLLSERLIARGVGEGPVQVTLYDHRGVHIFMNIDGRFFGTSDGAGGGNPRGGAGWLADGAPDASSRVYRAYHFLPRVLKGSTNAGHIMSFQLTGSGAPIVLVGDAVQVSYEETRAGILVTTAVSFPGAITTSGTVTSIAPDGSSFTLQTPSGSLTFSAADPSLIQNLAIGDSGTVTYTSSAGVLTARSVTVTSPAASNSPGGYDGAGNGAQP